MPETTSPWLKPMSTDHDTGLTALRSIAAPALFVSLTLTLTLTTSTASATALR